MKKIKLQQYLMSKKLQKAYSPFADTDKDGFVNMMDCYPFDKNKHGVWDWVKQKFKKEPTVKRTTIAPTTTAVRSVDIIKTDGGGGGAITVKGKTAWRGGGGTPSGQAPTQIDVTGVNVPPEDIYAFGERKGIVGGAPLPPEPEPELPPEKKKTWLGASVLGFSKPVVSAFTGIKTLGTISGEKERAKNLALIKKYDEGKELTGWEQSKLRQLNYDISERYPKTEGGGSITQTYLKGTSYVSTPIVEALPEGVVKKTLKKPAPDWSIELLDFFIKATIFGAYLKTGASKQKQEFRKLSDREKLEIYNRYLDDTKRIVTYDKVKAREGYAKVVAKYGKNSKETKALEKLIKEVLPDKEAEILFKDALQQEGLITERSIFSGGVQPKGITWTPPKQAVAQVDLSEVVNAPRMEQVEAVATSSKALQNVFNIFKVKTKTDVREQQREKQLLGGVSVTKTRLEFRPKQDTKPAVDTKIDFIQFFIPKITTKPATPPFVPPPRTTYKPPKKPPTKFLLPFIPIDGNGRARTRYKKSKDYFKALRKAYQPSVGAVVLGIKAKKKPFKLTGLELRPIISKKGKGIKRKKTNYLQNVNKMLM